MTVSSALAPLSPDARMLVALDIDGTLVRGGHRPTARAVAAVQALASRGVMIVLATGRQLHGVVPVVQELGLEQSWVVASDGAIVARFDGTESTVRAVHMFDPRPLARRILTQDPSATVGCEDVGTGYLVNRRFDTVIEPEDPQRIVAEFPGAVTMFTASSPRLTGQELAQAALAEGLSCTGWDEAGCGWVDAAARGLSKATGVKEAIRAAGAAPQTTVAVGDFFNDIALLQWADIGIAMGHAPPEVHEAADHVAPSIVDDGVVEVLEGLLSPAA